MVNMNPFEPVKIRTISASQQIYEHVKEAIINDDLTSNEKLTETVLSNWLQVSRTPLREALQRLEAEKWLVRLQGGGFKVMELEKENVTNLFEVRAVLEGLLTREVTPMLTDDDLEKISEMTKKMYEGVVNKDKENIAKYGETIHHYILAKSQNTFAKDMLVLIHDQIRFFRKHVLVKVPDLHKAYDEHVEILEALVTRDSDRVERAIRVHFSNAGKRLVNCIE